MWKGASTQEAPPPPPESLTTNRAPGPTQETQKTVCSDQIYYI